MAAGRENMILVAAYCLSLIVSGAYGFNVKNISKFYPAPAGFMNNSADIINGASAMRGPGLYTFFPGSPRWGADKTELSYGFSPDHEVYSQISLTDLRTVVARAFQHWAAVIPITFTESSSYDSADIKIGFYSGDHGDGHAFDGPLGTLAHSVSPPYGSLHFDAAESWTVDLSSNSAATAIDLESIATHEIGHLLGLTAHTTVEAAIMYPYISARTIKVKLALDDVEGIQSLYGANPNYNASTVLGQNETSAASLRNDLFFIIRLHGLFYVFLFFAISIF